MNKLNHSSIIRWITSFIVLAALFFVLPASCDDPNTNGGSTNGGGNGGGDGGTMPPPPDPDAPGITPGGFYTSVTVTITMTSMPGATIYYRAAADNTTDLSALIDPDDNTTYTGIGTSVNTPTTFTSLEDVYRIKARAVLADGRRTPETDIQIFGYDIDVDDDRLIEIRNLDMFSNIRNNLAGTGYAGIAVPAGGCPTAGCNGYELMTDLDFDQESSYVSGSANWTNKTWRPVDEVTPDSNSMDEAPDSAVNAGFPGIGPASGNTGGFTGIFEGNGNSISNFYSRNTADTNNANIGLFALTSSGTIRNLAVVDANVFGGGNIDRIGGLVGNNAGTIIASSVLSTGTGTSSADGGDGVDIVGGLLGFNSGNIIASYATGSADGGDGNVDNVGGLVGSSTGIITASYATGNADGRVGSTDQVGGLVGLNDGGSITASYATGDAGGGAGDTDRVGGLVGNNEGTITASYATGVADGGAENTTTDFVGGLVGRNNFIATSPESYGFGTATGGAFAAINSIGTGTNLPTGVTTASGLTALNAGTSPWWNAASMTGAGAWDFGTATENPALVYSDYDGNTVDPPTGYPSCSDANGLFLTIPGTTTQIVCGTTLVGGFRPPTP